MGTRRRTRRGGVYSNRDPNKSSPFLAARDREQRLGVKRSIGLPAQRNLTELRAELEKLAINRPAPQDKAALKEWDAKVARLLPTLRATEQAYFRALLMKLPTDGRPAEVPIQPAPRPPADPDQMKGLINAENPLNGVGLRAVEVNDCIQAIRSNKRELAEDVMKVETVETDVKEGPIVVKGIYWDKRKNEWGGPGSFVGDAVRVVKVGCPDGMGDGMGGRRRTRKHKSRRRRSRRHR